MTTTWPKAEKRISRLRTDIGKLGNPNKGAIEEYKRVSERYEYLLHTGDDIQKSESELTGIIGEITRQMKEIFARAV